VKDSYYFPHDFHARHDPKLAALQKIFGPEGYGIYWIFIEILHECGGKIEKFPLMYKGLALELNVNEATLQEIIECCLNGLKLLKEDENNIWSERVLQNIKEREEKRVQRVEAGRVGGIISGKRRKKTKQNEATLEANEANEAKESKVKESKVKESKELRSATHGLHYDPPYVRNKLELLKLQSEILKNKGV
jgi:hypothetical protein